jgi:hypothetical protein
MKHNDSVDIDRNHNLAQTNLLEDPGFESGDFSVWTNEEDSATNTIQSAIVHDGSYALKMESVYSSPTSWLPVHQAPTVTTSLADNPTLTAAIYPLVTGITCGEYGQASIVLFLYDHVAVKTQRLIYVWSGYDFPGTDTSENDTRGYFKFYGWSTDTWHILTRDLLVDYSACYGTPSNSSAVTLTRLYIYNHASNGQPGTFYADDVQITNDVEPLTTTTWHDDCTSTNGWISQNTTSGFDPKHVILESGTLSTTGGYLTVAGIADPVTERKGPLFIKDLGNTVSIEAIKMFQAEVEFTYLSDTYGFLSVYLFDENKQKAVMLRLHDAWAASESHPESVYFSPGEAGDGTVHDEILFGSWSGHLRFWYDESTESLVGELDDGTPNSATLKTSGNFDPYRAIKYIGIQWSRHPGATYGDDTYRLLDVQLTYVVSETASNWLTGWDNRKAHQILGTSGAGVNYQVKITVNYGTGTDSDNNVYTDFKCQSDFDDIRFTDDDGATLLDYWRESYFESDNATFWVEVRDNLDSDVSIYMYYDNPNCTTTSNGAATFVFFDDFDDGTIDSGKWETYGPWTESGGVTSFSIVGTGGTSVLPDLMSDDAWDMRNKSIVSRWRVNALTVNREWGVSCANTVGDDHTRLAYFLALNTSGNDNVRSYYDASAAPDYDYYNLIIGQYPPSVFMKTEFVSTPNNITKNSWILDGNVLDTYSGNSFDSTPQRIFLGFYVHGYTNTLVSGNLEMEFDYVYLRNQIGTEINHGSWSEYESWLDGWNYRKSHNIIGSTGAGENYQIKIIVHHGYGTDSGEDVYCRERCQSDFDDIRFTDNDGFTLLDSWTESVVDSDSAIFWVEVKDNLDSDVSIYMYFGNTTSTASSNGTATFAFFDDFESGTFDKWDMVNGWSISTTYQTEGVYGAYSAGGASQPQLRHNMSQTESFLISMNARTFDNFNTFPFLMSTDVGSSYPCTFGWTNVLYHTGSYTNWPQNSSLSYNTWYNMQIGFDMNLGKVRGWKNQDYMGEVDFASTTGATPSNVSAFRPAGGTQSTRHLALDNVYIRKWVPLEPAHGAWEGFTPVSPSIDDVEDFGYEAGTSENVIVWNIANFTPASYELYRDEGLLSTGVWPGGTQIEFDINNLAPGEYNYTIVVFGEGDISVSDSAIITVTDSTNPSLGHPVDVIYEYGTTGHSIVWSVSDLYPDEYVIYREGISIMSDAWTAGSITLDIDGLAIGEYNYTIKMSDTTGNSAVDTAIVTVVDTTAPILNHPSDIMFDFDTTSIQIAWQPTDLLPFNYVIYQNGTQVSSGLWTSGENLTYTLVNIIASSYNITIAVWDTSGNYASDTVFVSIDEGSIPAIGDYMVITISIGSIAVLVIVVGLVCRNKRGSQPVSPVGYDW